MQYIHHISKRARNLTIKISPKAEVIVVTPARYPARLLEKFIQEKEPWIKQTLAKINIRRQLFIKPQHVLIFGKEYQQVILNTPDKAIGIFTRGNKLEINLLTNKPTDTEKNTLNSQAKIRLTRFFKNTAEKYLIPRTYKLAEKMQLKRGEKFKFNKITLRAQQTRWGSCSSRGGLNFNWRLVHLNPDVIDYVIIHELAHLEQMNHSQRFWAIVAKFDSDYKRHRQLLRKYQYTID